MHLLTSNKGWHSHWFYVKDDVVAPLPMFSGCIIEEVPESWKWGVLDKEKKKIKDHLAALQILKEGREGVGDHRRLPHEEGGAADGACTSSAPDGAWSVTRRDGAC